MAVILSGASGALYYKPAGTAAMFDSSKVSVGSSIIDIPTKLNFKPKDPVKFYIRNSVSDIPGTGLLPAPLSEFTTYYVVSHNRDNGELTVSASSTLSPVIQIADVGAVAFPDMFEVKYAEFGMLAEAREWTMEIARTEISVDTIGQKLDNHVPLRKYISGYGDGTGSATLYITEEDALLSSRMIEDVLLYKQAGATIRLYIDKVEVNGTPDDAKSKFLELGIALTSASMTVNADDGQVVQVGFRSFGTVAFEASSNYAARFFLLEDGDCLLAENGNKLLLELSFSS